MKHLADHACKPNQCFFLSRMHLLGIISGNTFVIFFKKGGKMINITFYYTCILAASFFF